MNDQQQSASHLDLTVPLPDGRSVYIRVPSPMTQEDYELTMKAMALWKRGLVAPEAAKEEA